MSNHNNTTEEVVMESTESEIIEAGFTATSPEDNSDSLTTPPSSRKRTRAKKIDILTYHFIISIFIGIILLFLSSIELDSIEQNNQLLLQNQAQENIAKIKFTVDKRIRNWRNKLNKIEFPLLDDNQEIVFDSYYPGTKLLYLAHPVKHKAIVDTPSQGYPVLALLDGLKSESISQFELVKPKSEHEAIILGSLHTDSKKNKTSKKDILGFYLLFLPASFTEKIMADIELYKGMIILSQGGTSGIKLFESHPLNAKSIQSNAAIKNTQWQLSYFLGKEKASFSLSSHWLFIAYILFAIVSIFYACFALFKLIKKQVKQKKEVDTNSILNDKASISTIGSEKSQVLHDHSKKLALDEEVTQNINDKIKPEIINNYGFRGIFEEQINPQVFTRLGHAIALEIENYDDNKLTIGHDGRSSSKKLYQGLIKGLKGYEIEIIDLGLVCLPVVYYSALAHTQSNAIMISAGSSSKEYNGLKILLHGQLYTKSKFEMMAKQEYENIDKDLCKLTNKNINHKYINEIVKQFDIKRELTIVLDLANGVAADIAPDLMKTLGCNVITIADEINGSFPSHSPNPSKIENLQALVDMVKSKDADLGISYNSDGSALGVVASNGEIIWPDRLLMFLAQEELRIKPNAKILYDIKSSSEVNDWIIKYHGEPELSPSGCSLIKQRMDANKSILAGEYSGHFYFSDHLTGLDDAFYSSCKILQLISSENINSSEIFKKIPEKISTPEILIAVQPGQKDLIIKKIISQKSEFMPAGIITIDGFRAEYPDGWGMVRASQTSCSLSLRFEAGTSQALQRIAEKFKEVILSVVFVKFPY